MSEAFDLQHTQHVYPPLWLNIINVPKLLDLYRAIFHTTNPLNIPLCSLYTP